MLLDDRNVVDTDASFVLGEVEKHDAGPLITEEREYEMRFDNMQPNVWCGGERQSRVLVLLSNSIGLMFRRLCHHDCTPTSRYDPVPYPGRKKWRAWYSAFTSWYEQMSFRNIYGNMHWAVEPNVPKLGLVSFDPRFYLLDY